MAFSRTHAQEPLEFYEPCSSILTSVDADNSKTLEGDEFPQALSGLSAGTVQAASLAELPTSLLAIAAEGASLDDIPSLCTSFYEAILEQLGSTADRRACATAFIVGDSDRDNVFSRSEYPRFCNRLSLGVYDLGLSFQDLPLRVQRIFDLFAADDTVDIYGGKMAHTGATDVQLANAMNFCRQTTIAIALAERVSPEEPAEAPVEAPVKAPVTTPMDPPVDSPLQQKYSFDLDVCRRQISLSDRSRDQAFDRSEYAIFCSRLSDGDFADTFEELPAVIQRSFETLAQSFGDGTTIDVSGGRSGPPIASDQLPRIEAVCFDTQDALNAASNGESEPDDGVVETNLPTGSPVREVAVDYAACRNSMRLSDRSRDGQLNEAEYVRFCSRQTDLVGSNDAFDSLPQGLQDNFVALAGASTDDATQISISGATGTPVDAGQTAFLDQVCLQTALAVERVVRESSETDAPVLVPTGGPIQSPLETPVNVPIATPVSPDETPVTAPMELPVAAPVDPPMDTSLGTLEPTSTSINTATDLTVFNAFILANNEGYTAASLRSGPPRRALNGAYETFVANFVKVAVDHSRLRLRRALRTLRVTGLVDNSINFYIIEDTSCPTTDSVEADAHCIAVYVSFLVSIDGPVNATELTLKAQQAIAAEDGLTLLLGSDSSLVFASTTDIIEPVEETAAPVAAPNFVEKEDNSGIGLGLIIGIASGGAVLLCAVGVFLYSKFGGSLDLSRLKALKRGLRSRRNRKGSDKTGEGSEQNLGAEMAPNRGSGDTYGFDQDQSNGESDNHGGLFGSPDVSEEPDEEEAAGFNVQEQSPERSRMRGNLDKKPGNVLHAFGGLAGGLVQGVQHGVQTVGGEVMKGAKTIKTVGQTTIGAAGGVVGTVVGTATGGLVGKRKTQQADGNDFLAQGTEERDLNDTAEDFANYAFDEPVEVTGTDDRDPFKANPSDPWNTGNDWNTSKEWSAGELAHANTSFNRNERDDGSRSYNTAESGSASESYNDVDDFTRDTFSMSMTGAVLPENMRHLDAMVDKGDWDGVMEAAAKFEDNFDNYSAQSSRVSGANRTEGSKSVVSEEVSESTSRSETDYGDASFTGDQSLKASSHLTLSSEEIKRRDQYRKQVEALVKQCVPDEIDNINTMMDQFAGREAELINTLQSMAERTASQRARKAVHRSKAIPERENKPFSPGGTDGTTAIAAVSTIGGGYGEQPAEDNNDFSDQDGSYDDQEEGSYSQSSRSQSQSYYSGEEDDGNYSQGSGSYSPDSGSYSDRSGSYSQRSGSYSQQSGSYSQRSDSYSQRSGSYSRRSGSFSQQSDAYSQQSRSYRDGDEQYDDDQGSYSDQGSRSYDSRSQRYSEGSHSQSGSYNDEDDRSRSYRSGSYGSEGSGSYRSGASGSYGDEDGSRQYDEDYGDEDRSGSYSGSYDDEEPSGSYDSRQDGAYDDQQGSYSGSYEDDGLDYGYE